MNAEADRYRLAKQIYCELIALPEAARAEVLANRCGSDHRLRADIDALLAVNVDTAASPDSGPAPIESIPAPAGFRLLRELGRGGMGVVYLAERDTEEFQQLVAIKLLARAALQSDDRLARFRGERRILARLNHPHIARLLDGGALPDGTPFLVMEYVEGRRLDHWREQVQPGLRETLAMFVSICRAVHAAHQQLIVHRDLKPANILIDAAGAPKLLDFGIAKLVGDEEDGFATGTGLQLLTPRYAAPEQIRGEAVTTATDVYALGVILFELLVGKPPFGDLSTPELLRATTDTEPQRPSTAVRRAETTAPLYAVSALAGDIDAIVLKCLRKDADARYRGAAELADDIEAYLAGRAVAARAGSRRYAAIKFIGRHRYLVASTVLVMLVLAVASWILLAQLQETRRQRDLAEQQKLRAEQALILFKGVLTSTDLGQTRGKELTAREILEAGARKTEQNTELPADLRFDLLMTIAEAEVTLGLEEQAAKRIESAAAMRGVMTPQEAISVDFQRLLALNRQGKSAEAERLSARLIADADRQPGLWPPDEFARLLVARANALNLLGRGAETETLLKRALDLLPNNADAALVRASINSQLGQNLQNLGRLAEAETYLRAALDFQTKEYLDPLRTSRYQNNLAGVLAMQGRFQDALDLHLPALDALIKQLGDQHPEVGVRLNNVGMTEHGAGKLDDALVHLRAAHEFSRQHYGADSPMAAMVGSNLAGVLIGAGQFDAALPLLQDALARLQAKYGENGLFTLRAERTLGALSYELGDPVSASARFQRCVDGLIAGKLEQNPLLARCRIGLVEIAIDQGELARADDLLRAAEEQQQQLDARHFERGLAGLVRARWQLRQQDPGAALATLRAIHPQSLNEPWQQDWLALLVAASNGCREAAPSRQRLGRRYPHGHARLHICVAG